MKSINQHKKDLITICKLLYSKDLISATDGNVSIKIDEERILATPSRLNKGLLTEDQLVITDFDGKVIEGEYKSSSEMKLHSKIYKERPDINAVVHSHPAYSTAFALAGQPIPNNYLIETLVLLGEIGLAPYGTPSTEEVPASIDGLVEGCNGILLKNHGVVTYGKDIFDAFNKMEALENVAKTIVFSHLLGGPKEIPKERIEFLQRILDKKNK